MKTNDLFRSCLSNVSTETKTRFDLSFDIAERISMLLEKKGITKKELARRLGKRESEVSKWLTGRHNFTISTIASIQTALGCDLL